MNAFQLGWTLRAEGMAFHPPNPQYPEGIDLDISAGATLTCTASLPYPAQGIGLHGVKCTLCGLTALATATGRPDDPRSIKVACKPFAGRA